MTRPLTIEECEAAIKGEEELRSFNSRKSERETPTFIERIARAYIELRAAHDASQQTIRELRADKERLDWFDANVASVADVCGIPDAETPLFIVTLLTHDSHEIFRGETLREAIDAARSAPERGEASSKGGSNG